MPEKPIPYYSVFSWFVKLFKIWELHLLMSLWKLPNFLIHLMYWGIHYLSLSMNLKQFLILSLPSFLFLFSTLKDWCKVEYCGPLYGSFVFSTPKVEWNSCLCYFNNPKKVTKLLCCCWECLFKSSYFLNASDVFLKPFHWCVIIK